MRDILFLGPRSTVSMQDHHAANFDAMMRSMRTQERFITGIDPSAEARSPWPGLEPETPMEVRTYGIPRRAPDALPGSVDVITVTTFQDGTVIMEAPHEDIRIVRKGPDGPYAVNGEM